MKDGLYEKDFVSTTLQTDDVKTNKKGKIIRKRILEQDNKHQPITLL